MLPNFSYAEQPGSAQPVYIPKVRNELPVKSHRVTKTEAVRAKATKKLITAGPVPLNQLMQFGLEHNDEIRAAAAQMKVVAGDKWIIYSRFLPHLFYEYDLAQADTGGTGETRENGQFLSAYQTLLEFGRETPPDILLRDSQRKALYAYENKVRDVLSGIRTRFFSVLLRERQIAERETLLTEYRAKYEKLKELESMRRVLEVEVLTARLNVLNEEARTNELQRDLLRQKLDLTRLAGLPVKESGFLLRDELEELRIRPDSCVTMALTRSTQIAQAAADVVEQRKFAHRTWWEHAPEVELRSGWADSTTSAGLSVQQKQGTHSVSAFGRKDLERPESAIELEEGWFLDLKLKIPILQGLSVYGMHKKENAKLERNLLLLHSTVDSVEIRIRNAYSALEEQKKQLEILRETAVISRQRLQIKERLREIDKISDDELETFRNQFFAAQNTYYEQQIALTQAQEALRYEMYWFEPLGVHEGATDRKDGE